MKLIHIIYSSNRQAKKGIYNRYNWVASSLNVLRAIESVGVKVHVKGMSNFQKFEGPAVFVGNHMSTMETLLLPSFIQPAKTVIYVIKKELIDFPLFGPVASARFPIVVGRTNPREDLKIVMEEGSENLQKGKSIIIFPQKTRSKFFDPSSFNSLGIKLAKRNNVPVVPIAIVTDAWSNGKLLKDFGTIDTSKIVNFEFGEPMRVDGNGSEEHEKTLKFISDKFREWDRNDLILER